jgi:hypothetical protein
MTRIRESSSLKFFCFFGELLEAATWSESATDATLAANARGGSYRGDVCCI